MYIIREKDKLELLEQNGLVYKNKCKDCEASYVGQTKRQLGTRIKEHKTDKKNGSTFNHFSPQIKRTARV